MSDPSKIGKLLQQIAMGVNAHDRENPDHNTWGIGMAHFDIERLDLEEGEELIPGIVLHADGGQTGQFRILCDGQHDQGEVEALDVEVRHPDPPGVVVGVLAIVGVDAHGDLLQQDGDLGRVGHRPFEG